MSLSDVKSIIVQNIEPIVNGGDFPIKRRVGDKVKVSCEAFRHGHDTITVLLQYRVKGKRKWQEIPMNLENKGLDLYKAEFQVEELGFYEYSIVAYTDFYLNWASDTKKKLAAGESLKSEILEGLQILVDCADRASVTAAKKLRKQVDLIHSYLSDAEKVSTLLSDEVIALAAAQPDRKGPETSGVGEIYKVRVDRREAEFASWYEMFPRSATSDVNRHGTFADVEKQLPYIQDMGFDVLYFTPIHPVGLQKRKGRNNTLVAYEGDPGSPYAIGAEEGGHFAVHPELGTIEDFDKLVATSAEKGIEIALDFALNCSPDHPYLKDHPDWFYTRPDGTIKFAENPPKKYEDIYPLNFACADSDNLWREIRDILLFWAEHGVRIFRVDNPHTKPIRFWEWCIEEVQKQFQDVIFLSEAFTRPRLLESLAKAGFTQSYGYFTWRESAEDIKEYYNYLANSPAKEYLINNTFPTTPDILPKHLHYASRELFMIRLTMAATLSSVYGMYSGYELCENEPAEHHDELNFSEKYEIKVRNFNDPISIAPYVKKINEIRKTNPALQYVDGLRFHETNNPNILFYTRSHGDNTLLIFVNLNASHKESSFVEFPLEDFGLGGNSSYRLRDLLTGECFTWHGKSNYVELSPNKQVAHIFKLERY